MDADSWGAPHSKTVERSPVKPGEGEAKKKNMKIKK